MPIGRASLARENEAGAIKFCSILAIVGENGGHFEFWSREHSRTLL